MTGAYLFGKDKDGKRVPMEIEFLTKEEREKAMAGRDEKELIGWIHMLCENIQKTEKFLLDEGYSREHEWQ